VIHLDTNFLIHALRTGSAQAEALERLLTGGDSLGLSSIAWSEFCCGSPSVPVTEEDRHQVTALVGQPVRFGAEDALLAAELFNSGGRRRGSLPDAMIAAVAIRSGATLATVNRKDFRPFESAGLRLLDA
jgi:predicted nucleic acid-binding protein